jgi:hypothetical protein
MSEMINTPSITDNEAANTNRNAIEHRATWMGLSYEVAKESGIDIEKILRSVVGKTGCLHGAAVKSRVHEPIKLNEFCDAFLTPVATTTFEMEFKTKTEDSLEIRFHYCPLVSGWLKAGIPDQDIPKLCDIAMDGDRNIASTVGLGFSLGRTIAAGDLVCEVNFFRKK